MNKIILFLLCISSIYCLKAENTVNVNAGVSSPMISGLIIPTVGLNYEYRDDEFSNLFAVGFNAEAGFYDNQMYKGMFTFNLMPVKEVMISIAPGAVFEKFKTPVVSPSGKISENEIYFNLRLSASYRYDIQNRFFLTPRIISDIFKNDWSPSFTIGFGIYF